MRILAICDVLTPLTTGGAGFYSSWPEELKIKFSPWPVILRSVAARLKKET